jgi:hypothetical protein
VTGDAAPPDDDLVDADLADALADRALGRIVSALAVGALALAVMALLFVLLADGALDERSLPQVLVLGAGWLVGTVAAVAISRLLMSLRSSVRAGRRGLGPQFAAAAVRWADRVVVGVPVLGALAAAVSVWLTTRSAPTRPVATAVLSAAVGLAVVSQLAVLAAVQRVGLRRAAQRR